MRLTFYALHQPSAAWRRASLLEELRLLFTGFLLFFLSLGFLEPEPCHHFVYHLRYDGDVFLPHNETLRMLEEATGERYDAAEIRSMTHP